LKSLLYIFFILCFSSSLIAQESGGTEVYTIVEQMPEFPGGSAAMMDFLKKNIKYPSEARENGVGGKSFIKFVVNEQGQIENVVTIKSAGLAMLDEEAIRVVRSMPLWAPGKQQGRNVKVFYNLPISFAMNEPYIVFSATTTNADYLSAKEAILKGKTNQAIETLQKLNGEIDAWFCLGVLYYQKKDFEKSRHYFENIRSNTKNEDTIFKTLSDRFLNNYFDKK
jgi:TonB family protein